MLTPAQIYARGGAARAPAAAESFAVLQQEVAVQNWLRKRGPLAAPPVELRQRGERRPSRHALRMVYLRGGQVQTSRSFVDELLNLPYALYAFVCFFFQTLIDVRRRPPHTPPHYHR